MGKLSQLSAIRFSCGRTWDQYPAESNQRLTNRRLISIVNWDCIDRERTGLAQCQEYLTQWDAGSWCLWHVISMRQCHKIVVMKMRNIVPRVRIEPASLAFQASVPTISPSRLPSVTTLPMPTCLCGSLPERSVQTITL